MKNRIILIAKVEHIPTHLPLKMISILGDFNVHNQLWLSSPSLTKTGELIINIAIIHDSNQVQVLPDIRLGYVPENTIVERTIV